MIVKTGDYGTQIIPTLGSIALGIQKILPTSQIIYSSWALLGGSKASLISVLNLLELPLIRSKGLDQSANFEFNLFNTISANSLIVNSLGFPIFIGPLSFEFIRDMRPFIKSST